MEAYRDQYAQLFRGGRDIVLLAVSTDSPEAQQSWARDADFPFLFASDPGSEVGKRYGAWRESRGGVIDNRTVFVIDSEGVIRWVAAPFREIDPTAYEELGQAIARTAPVENSSDD
ncbi:MAG: peroxiredoxin family protein [Gemmatimonadota bacterium]|nr:peroxiredoxin family protein [Gemmatimonadota bacterium]